MRKTRVPTFDSIFFLAFTLLFGCFALAFALWIRQDLYCRNWPSVPGSITSSRVQEHESMDSHGRTSVTYRPVIKYAYAVAGTQYDGERIGNGVYPGFTPWGARRMEKPFPRYAKVPVYYNPANPARSILMRTRLANDVGFVLMVAATAACAYCLSAGVRLPIG
jgi:hypothetical protein